MPCWGAGQTAEPSDSGRVGQLRRAATKGREDSPLWHRRLRKKRAAARKLLKVVAAKRLLKAHHGSQAPGMGRDDKASPSPKVLRGAREPCWECKNPKCGFDKNWASRLECLHCQAEAPASVVRKAEAASASAKAWKKNKGWQEEGGWRKQSKGGRRPKWQGLARDPIEESSDDDQVREKVADANGALLQKFFLNAARKQKENETAEGNPDSLGGKGEGKAKPTGAEASEAARLVLECATHFGQEHQYIFKLLQDAVVEKKKEVQWAKPGGTRLKEADIARERKTLGLKKAQAKFGEMQEMQRVLIEQARIALADAEAEVQAAREALEKAQSELQEAESHREQVVKSIAGTEGAKEEEAKPAQLAQIIGVLDPSDPADKACLEHWAGRVAKAAMGGKADAVDGPHPDVAMHPGSATGGGGTDGAAEARAAGGPASASPARAVAAQAGARGARGSSRSRSPEKRSTRLAEKLRSLAKRGAAPLSPEQLQAAQKELWEAATKQWDEEEESL